MTKDRFYCLRQLACNARGDLELEAQDALAEIERLHQKDRIKTLEINVLTPENRRLRAALECIRLVSSGPHAIALAEDALRECSPSEPEETPPL